jgi:hypothetical protein
MSGTGNISFLSTIKEIESSYVSLEKSNRLKIERWVERLVSSAGNESWLRHRNAYARLLLSQVLAKKLEEPFNVFPPEGSLCPFPRHLLHRLRKALGTHESSFWRELYSRMDLDAVNFEPVSSVPPAARAREAQATKIQSLPAQAQAQAQPPLNTAPISIPSDLMGMKMLIREQMNRIAILEEQLRIERLSHRQEIEELLLRRATIPVAPSITSKRIIPKNSRQGLKIYDIPKASVFYEDDPRENTNSLQFFDDDNRSRLHDTSINRDHRYRQHNASHYDPIQAGPYNVIGSQEGSWIRRSHPDVLDPTPPPPPPSNSRSHSSTTFSVPIDDETFIGSYLDKLQREIAELSSKPI